jgi:hypothetical protein
VYKSVYWCVCRPAGCLVLRVLIGWRSAGRRNPGAGRRTQELWVPVLCVCVHAVLAWQWCVVFVNAVCTVHV